MGTHVCMKYLPCPPLHLVLSLKEPVRLEPGGAAPFEDVMKAQVQSQTAPCWVKDNAS